MVAERLAGTRRAELGERESATRSLPDRVRVTLGALEPATREEAMDLTDRERAFLESTRSAAMITLRPDGRPHAVRVGFALVDGKLWVSGVRSRVRNAHLRRDPRCTLFVFDPAYSYLTLEASATIIDSPEVPEMSLRLFRAMQGRPAGDLLWEGVERTPEEFLRIMKEEQRIIYEFEVVRAYGLYGDLAAG
jgi:PPOX class probable F420-dependent enzyme